MAAVVESGYRDLNQDDIIIIIIILKRFGVSFEDRVVDNSSTRMRSTTD